MVSSLLHGLPEAHKTVIEVLENTTEVTLERVRVSFLSADARRQECSDAWQSAFVVHGNQGAQKNRSTKSCCLNCGNTGHVVTQCPDPCNARRKNGRTTRARHDDD